MIDFHCHSTCSDGTLTPEELAERGRAFAAFALTDHDTCAGGVRFLAAARPHAGLRLVGIELSIEPGDAYDTFHLLGLGIDPTAPRLNALLEDIRAGRVERNLKIIANLAQLGLPVALDEVRAHAGGDIIARPHIALALMDHGWAVNVKDAFARLIGHGQPAYAPRYRPSQADAIAAIHDAGGIAIMAHPHHWAQDSNTLRTGLRHLKDLDLDGIEAIYQANPPDVTIDHLRAARELDLLVTAGSDFHGANKPDIHIGMAVDDEETFLAPLRARLTARAQAVAGRAATPVPPPR